MDFFQGNELSGLSVPAFEDLDKRGGKLDETYGTDERAPPRLQNGVIQLTVAYVPSPSFSNCWNELGCRLPSIFEVGRPSG